MGFPLPKENRKIQEFRLRSPMSLDDTQQAWTLSTVQLLLDRQKLALKIKKRATGVTP
jgi:hypothetical protein